MVDHLAGNFEIDRYRQVHAIWFTADAHVERRVGMASANETLDVVNCVLFLGRDFPYVTDRHHAFSQSF